MLGGIRERIIYSHTPGRNGFRYFYLSYMDGERGVMLKYRRIGAEAQMMAHSVTSIADFLQQKRREPSEEWPFEVIDRAQRIFAEQVRRWQEREQQAAG